MDDQETKFRLLFGEGSDCRLDNHTSIMFAASPLVHARNVRGVQCRGLKENVAKLPPISGIRRVTVPALDNYAIDNVEGKKASVAIFHHLAQEFGGKLTPAAAQLGLELYGEYVEEAKQQPGSHPNIDLLLRVVEQGLTLDVVCEQQ